MSSDRSPRAEAWGKIGFCLLTALSWGKGAFSADCRLNQRSSSNLSDTIKDALVRSLHHTISTSNPEGGSVGDPPRSVPTGQDSARPGALGAPTFKA